jgi:hypothetical protein
MQMTSKQTRKQKKDVGASSHAASYPALIALVRLLARSAAVTDFERERAQQDADRDEAE